MKLQALIWRRVGGSCHEMEESPGMKLLVKAVAVIRMVYRVLFVAKLYTVAYAFQLGGERTGKWKLENVV